ncbi:carbohydrate esterase [Triangularia setosa]|uniref:Carbohydrate esterase n=1 Tax=Triangularia setosa TaxID=2587417 RepID=A0AAN7A4H3_9PEZI|nr:carbohydrate esterase [Podospora setosa]
MNSLSLVTFLALSVTFILTHGVAAHTTKLGNQLEIVNDTLVLDQHQDIRCGRGLASCPAFSCCSLAGYCGYSATHCGAHCQVGHGHCEIDTIQRVRRDHFRPGNRGRPLYDCTPSNTIALTFDNGPSEQTGPLLDLLRREGVKATFFVNGQGQEPKGYDTRAGIWPSILRRIINEGHQLASHTWGHLENLNREAVESRNQQMMWNEIMFRDILGFFPTYMRAPHGNCDGACLTQMGNLGYTVVMWNLDTEDWKNQPASNIWKSFEKFSDELWNPNHKSYGKAIALAHDTLPATLDLAKHMIGQAKARKLQFVTVGQCLGDWDRANWYRDGWTGQRWAA